MIPIMGAVMRAIKINPETRTITEVDCNGLADEQSIVGGNIESAHYFDNGVDRIMVNESGLYSLPADSAWFIVEGAFNPFKGNGVVVGVDENTGDTVDAKISLEDLKSKVRFLTHVEVHELAQARAAYRTV